MAQKNTNLRSAQAAKNDEWYTMYQDLELEIPYYLEYNPDVFRNQTILLPCDDPEYSEFTKYFVANFEAFGIKKLISTSYANSACNQKITEFEKRSKCYDEKKHKTCGKIFVLERGTCVGEHPDINDLEWNYLEGNGDFRSDEVKALRDEADIIITNMPFSLARSFIEWIFAAPIEKKFLIIGNKNSVAYKEVFPLIKDNKMWLGVSSPSLFKTPDGTVSDKLQGLTRWFTNLDHINRHKEYQYMTMADNLRYNQKLIKTLNSKFNSDVYPKYDNYDVIEVPYCDAIPSDYDGVMAVPVTFLDRYNPNQFEILEGSNRYGILNTWGKNEEIRAKHSHGNNINDNATYFRIHIKRKIDTISEGSE